MQVNSLRTCILYLFIREQLTCTLAHCYVYVYVFNKKSVAGKVAMKRVRKDVSESWELICSIESTSPNMNFMYTCTCIYTMLLV